jgi:hypothetical protein
VPEEETDLWHVAEGGKTHGPYTFDMLRDRFNNGRFSKSALVWKNGLPSWQPIVLHFSAVEAPAPPAPAERVVQPVVRNRLSALFYVRWTLLAATILFFCLVVTGNAASNELSAHSYLLVRLGVVAAMALTAIAAAILWWRYASVSTGRDKATGLIRAGVVICSIAVVIATFASAMNTPLLYRVQIARESYNHYSVKVDIASGTLFIEGLVGPGLAREVSQQLRSNAAIKTVAINSIGGLVEEAMQTAHAIQGHGGLTTRAWGVCNSACILVFMSGEKRAADRDLVFGFHATSTVTPMSGIYNLEALDAEGAEASKYLASRGVPEAFISGARALGPGKLFSVSAIRMADVGAVTNLLDNGEPLSIARAKWLSVLDLERRVHAPESLIKLLSTVAALDPPSAEKFGPSLWAAAQVGDVAGLSGSMHSLMGELANKAVPAADDEPLADVTKITSIELQYLRESGRWDVCVGFLNGKGFGTIKPPARLLDADFTAQAALITSGAQNEWRARDVPQWTSAYGAAMAKTLAAKMVANGVNLQNLDTDTHVSCEWTTSLLTAISEKPAPVAASLYRWLTTGAK